MDSINKLSTVFVFAVIFRIALAKYAEIQIKISVTDELPLCSVCLCRLGCIMWFIHFRRKGLYEQMPKIPKLLKQT